MQSHGFIQGRLLRAIFIVGILGAGAYYGINWGKEYYRIKMAQTCSERMWLIEDAKDKFRKSSPNGKITMYADLLPYLPFTGFPMCPWGGTYSNELALDKRVECSLNGDPAYEPDTPGVDPKKNGYMDLHGNRKTVTLFEFFYQKANWENTEKDPLAEERKKEQRRTRLFDN